MTETKPKKKASYASLRKEIKYWKDQAYRNSEAHERMIDKYADLQDVLGKLVRRKCYKITYSHSTDDKTYSLTEFIFDYTLDLAIEQIKENLLRPYTFELVDLQKVD